MKYDEECIVILGRTIHDATDEYRRLFAQEPERVMGRRVVLSGTALSPRKLDGLRIHDWSESSQAMQGKHYADTVAAVKFGMKVGAREK